MARSTNTFHTLALVGALLLASVLTCASFLVALYVYAGHNKEVSPVGYGVVTVVLLIVSLWIFSRLWKQMVRPSQEGVMASKGNNAKLLLVVVAIVILCTLALFIGPYLLIGYTEWVGNQAMPY